jgi:hypothetical protein
MLMADASRITTYYWGWTSGGCPFGIEVPLSREHGRWKEICSTETGPKRDALLNDLRVHFFLDIEFAWKREYRYVRSQSRSHNWGFGSRAKEYREFAKRMVRERDAYLAHHQDNAIFIIDYLKAHPEVDWE